MGDGVIMEVINMIANIFMWIIIIQLTTIIHELGHGIPALFFSKDKVIMYLGITKTTVRTYNLGNFQVVLRGFHPFTGFVTWNNTKIKGVQELITVIGGPLISLLIAVGLFVIGSNLKVRRLSEVVDLAAYYNFYQFILTVVPMRYPKWWGNYGGYSSDGYKAVKLLKGKEENRNDY